MSGTVRGMVGTETMADCTSASACPKTEFQLCWAGLDPGLQRAPNGSGLPNDWRAFVHPTEQGHLVRGEFVSQLADEFREAMHCHVFGGA